ncbi:DUF389 domain-containing protein [Streptomyces sp. WMMC500]|uniref:DUF389 domain-containing protein n=1 Tax=Streptomyces sp. WMMC500 TaxID=3015154 RepID=UPI00248C1FEF|nr:DUF389 domain-containing protein [Streptomyces sp. WMMC500]WBB63708.1 DUF389 domain-containing protein [Streptomyces sp. WMMC500]
MLHLRIQCPAARTDEVVGLLHKTVGTAHLAVLRGASLDPEGDVVLCDVAREAADQLLHQLRVRGLCDEGAVSVDHVDLTLSRRADQAEEAAPGEAADAVVWESLVEETHEESALSLTFLAMLGVATLLASCGVMIDSAILIVGAMALGPEFGPVAGLCVALVQWRARLAARSVGALLAGFAVAMVLTVVFSVVMDAFGLFTEGDLEAVRPQTEFIFAPDWFSFIVALLAGTAGTLSLTSSKSGALVGVAISVTTVPAAANAAVAVSYGDWGQARGSSEQLLLNLLGIVVAGTLTLLVQKMYWAWHTEQTLGQHVRQTHAAHHTHKHL